MNKQNLTSLIGSVVNVPQLYYTKHGDAICRFAIAVNYIHFTNSDDKSQKIRLVSVNGFNRIAEICNDILKIGSTVKVEGVLKSETYIDRNCEHKTKIYINAVGITTN